ncbi:MAG TPA: hypothetical protein VGA78_01465 [Gemmatimonadales bacterium]|jgi:hypothetical protein
MGHPHFRGAFLWTILVPVLAACGGDNPAELPRPIPPIGNRATADRPAETSGSQIHIIYMVPADGKDTGIDTTGRLENSVGSFQNWLVGKVGKRIRQDTYQGRLDISFFKSSKADADIAASGQSILRNLYDELHAAGFDDPATKYLIYYDGTNPNTCGNAFRDGPAAALYLRGSANGKSCIGRFVTSPDAHPGYWEFAMLHEILHTLGMVDAKAPHHDATRPLHVEDGEDLMHGGGGTWLPDFVDRDNDDYYGDSVPSNARNLRNDPILVSAPAAAIARAQAQLTRPRFIPHFVHEVLEFKKP